MFACANSPRSHANTHDRPNTTLGAGCVWRWIADRALSATLSERTRKLFFLAVNTGFVEAGLPDQRCREFTKRAFLNGRIDLAQAEAVADLIHSRTEVALTAANEQLAGKLSRRILCKGRPAGVELNT